MKRKSEKQNEENLSKEIDKEYEDLNGYEEFEDYDEYLDEDFYYNFEENYNDYDFEEYKMHEKQSLIDEINEFANDKVEKNKTYEQYILEKTNEEELISFLGPQIITKKPEEISKIKKDIKKYIIENQNEIAKENIIYMPDHIIKEIKNAPQDGIIEIDIEEDIQEVLNIAKYDILKRFGLAFMDMNADKVIIHIPLIKEIKKYLEDKEITERQQKINEKVHLILGICELHGAIKTDNVYRLMKEFYGEIDEKQFTKFLIIACGILGIARIEIEDKTGSIQYIYQNWIDEKMAKKIIKSNKVIKTYTKKEYLKYGKEDFLVSTNGYKKLKEQFDSDIFDEDDLFELLNNLVIPYTVEARMGNKNIAEIMRMMERQLVDILGEEGLIELGLNTKEIEKSLQEITDELPKWI